MARPHSFFIEHRNLTDLMPETYNHNQKLKEYNKFIRHAVLQQDMASQSNSVTACGCVWLSNYIQGGAKNGCFWELIILQRLRVYTIFSKKKFKCNDKQILNFHRQNSKTFIDISHAFLPLAIAKLSTLKTICFWPTLFIRLHLFKHVQTTHVWQDVGVRLRCYQRWRRAKSHRVLTSCSRPVFWYDIFHSISFLSLPPVNSPPSFTTHIEKMLPSCAVFTAW